MQEYSRRASTAESRLEELHKRSVHHDDHLRIIDAWWLQVCCSRFLRHVPYANLDRFLRSCNSWPSPPYRRTQLHQVFLLHNSIKGREAPGLPTSDQSRLTRDTLDGRYLTGVTFKDLHDFQKHLQDKGKNIKSKAESLLNRIAAHRGELSPEGAKLEAKITALLASQKEYLLKLDRLSSEKEQLSEQLNAATLRYFKAEKKLDRAKSVQVQKLEQQAFAKVTEPSSGAGNGADGRETNGNANHGEILMKYEEATAAAAKQKEQIDKFLAEVKTLQDENSSLKARRDALTDEDYIRTDVFKQFKIQNEDLIKRINNLEATNKQLREEAEKLQAERTAFRTQLETDANQITQELEAEIITRDNDLTRVRSARDEILAENTQRKAHMERDRIALEQIKELAAAKDDRISALESEIARLNPANEEGAESSDVTELSHEDLQAKYKKLLLDFQSINQELPSIEKAYKKMKDLAQKKIMDFASLEERVSVLTAEKSKADQKYFAARKDADTRNNEIRSLRIQNGKSAEIIAQLKDLESQNRTLLSNLEKQMADLKQTNAQLLAKSKETENSSQESIRRAEALNKQVSDLTNLVKSKDAAAAAVKERNTAQETEAERLKVRVDAMQKDRDYWKTQALSNHSVEMEGLRVSLFLFLWTFFALKGICWLMSRCLAFCSLLNMRKGIQEQNSKNMWSSLLQGLHRRPHQQPHAEVSVLC